MVNQTLKETHAMRLTIAELEYEIRPRKKQLKTLFKRRVKVARALAAVDARMAKLGGGGANGNGNGHRPRNDRSLVATLESVMRSGKPMGIGDIARDVQAKGYKSHSANFRAIVNQTLIKEKQFQQASRGVYQLQKSA
jgi:hypothetical protein